MKFTIKCKCDWEYPIFETEQEAKQAAEKELDNMIKACNLNEADELKKRHTYEVVQVQ